MSGVAVTRTHDPALVRFQTCAFTFGPAREEVEHVAGSAAGVGWGKSAGAWIGNFLVLRTQMPCLQTTATFQLLSLCPGLVVPNGTTLSCSVHIMDQSLSNR